MIDSHIKKVKYKKILTRKLVLSKSQRSFDHAKVYKLIWLTVIRSSIFEGFRSTYLWNPFLCLHPGPTKPLSSDYYK